MTFKLALDEPGTDDIVEKIDGLTFLVEPDLCDLYRSFTITSVKYDSRILFRVTPEVQPASTGRCSSCDSCD